MVCVQRIFAFNASKVSAILTSTGQASFLFATSTKLQSRGLAALDARMGVPEMAPGYDAPIRLISTDLGKHRGLEQTRSPYLHHCRKWRQACGLTDSRETSRDFQGCHKDFG